MEITIDFRKRMIIKLVEVLKKTQRFSNIQFSLLKNIILNSEQQIFQKSRNKHEYEIIINKKIDHIKLSEYQFKHIFNYTRCYNTIHDKHRNTQIHAPSLCLIPDSIFHNNQVYHTAINTKYSHPLIMSRKTVYSVNSNQCNETHHQPAIVSTNNDLNSNSEVPNKLSNNSTIFSDFENIFNKKHKKTIGNTLENSNYRVNYKTLNEHSNQNDICNTDVLQNEIPKHVKFTINIKKKSKMSDKNNTEKCQDNHIHFSKYDTTSDFKSPKDKFNSDNIDKETTNVLSNEDMNAIELQTFIDNAMLKEVIIEDCAKWHDTLDFILSLGSPEKKYLLQSKYRHTKFISIKDMEEKINWYNSQIDYFIEEIINGFEKRKETKEDFYIVIK